MSNIQWTDETDNPIHLLRPDGTNGGHWCRKVSPGCTNCYAEEINQSGFFSFASHLPYTGNAPKDLHFDQRVVDRWRNVRSPKKRFVCSMTDLFGSWVPQEWQDKVFSAAKAAPSQTIQLLTKRPENMFHSISSWCDRNGSLPSNIWLGTTIENQTACYTRSPFIQKLSKVGLTWISYEPALEEVDLSLLAEIGAYQWIVVGGESGSNARMCDLQWLEKAVQTSQKHGIQVFAKQLGSKPYCIESSKFAPYKTRDRKGGNIDEFPENLQIRQFPQERS